MLRHHGHDVASAKEIMPGGSDRAVLEQAQAEARLVVTFDNDFGELAVRFRLPATCGVVLFRLNGASPEEDNRRVVVVLDARSDWAGHFAVVTDDRLRIRKLTLERPR